LRLELAQTTVPRAEAQTVVAGDVIVFAETRAPSAAAAIALHICHEGSKVGVRLAPDGSLELDQGEATMPIGTQDAGSLSNLANGVEITAEVGHWTDGADDALTSQEAPPPEARPLPDAHPSPDGPALEGGPRPGPISGDRVLLRLAGRDWAEGRVCELDGRLGVQVTRVFAG
jgi:hypothetical protein